MGIDDVYTNVDGVVNQTYSSIPKTISGLLEFTTSNSGALIASNIVITKTTTLTITIKSTAAIAALQNTSGIIHVGDTALFAHAITANKTYSDTLSLYPGNYEVTLGSSRLAAGATIRYTLSFSR